MEHTGSCHCGNISITLQTQLNPTQFVVRDCQCSFCRKHNSSAISDPDGKLTINISDIAQVNRYQFGLRTAEFLICRTCGVYVAACTLNEENKRGIVIVSTLDDAAEFTSKPRAVDYDAEDKAGRIERRNERWMPAQIKFDEG